MMNIGFMQVTRMRNVHNERYAYEYQWPFILMSISLQRQYVMTSPFCRSNPKRRTMHSWWYETSLKGNATLKGIVL